jgi:hypothetical protein
MTDNLRDSPFFGDRVINFTSDILNKRMRPTPITDFEKKLLKKEAELQELNDELDGKLLELLRAAKEFIVPPTAIRLLLYFKKIDRLNDAHKILYFSGRDEMVLTEADISDLVNELRKDPDASIELWLAVLANEPERQEAKGSGPKLNLPQDFR